MEIYYEKFDYTNRGPNPWAIVRTNEIYLFMKDGRFGYTRYYHVNGVASENGISGKLHNASGNFCADEAAKAIHWGCCGWSANSHDVHDLIERIQKFLDNQS